MLLIDKVAAALTPSESRPWRPEARARAPRIVTPGDWLSIALAHHRQIEAVFAEVTASATEATRRKAQKRLSVILTGHANAEESVLYPALPSASEKRHATSAYADQAAAKTQMSLLEKIAPMSPEYLEKLECIRDAVARHMHAEEGTWFAELKQRASAAEQATLTRRYLEEFNRYVGDADDFQSPRYASGAR